MTLTTAAFDALTIAVGDREHIHTDSLTRHARAHDASHFLHVPGAVVTARDAQEVGRIFRAAAAQKVAVTLRSGGTSLSGQAVGAGLLLDVRHHFRDVEILDDGDRVRSGPGVTIRQLNARLAPYGRKVGPDPASEGACTIGGVVANNSSGMACGTTENTYRTLDSMVLVLPSGTVVDTGVPDATARLRAVEPGLVAGIERLRDRVRSDAASVAEIRRQFAMKNTMGYGLNSLLDFTDPVEILAHLVVGSEGTLGFVSSVTLATVPLRPHAASALLVFADLESANRALPALVETGAATLELMDARSLRVGQGLAHPPAGVAALDVRDHAALLLEYQGQGAAEVEALVAAAHPTLAALALAHPVELTSDRSVRAGLWGLRKGLYAAVAGARRPGTTALLEDIVVPVEALADTCVGLGGLFDRFGYADSVVFGHAKDGNIHFLLTDEFTGAGLDRYAAFTDDMVDLVLGYGGSLKAEHGTGRVMAPYVRRQYGDELYDVMVALKHLVDPAGVLNPGVLLDTDPAAHLRHIKSAPRVEPEVDRCVECGYCEPVCPSKDLTLTPRQRIVVRRALAQAHRDGDHALVDELAKDYDYQAVQTCAADSMCATACPLGIDTSHLMKRIRTRENGPGVGAAWKQAAEHWDAVTAGASAALTVANSLPTSLVSAATTVGRAVLGTDTVPAWSGELPGGGRRRSALHSATCDRAPQAVYLPACVGAMFGPAGEGAGVQDAFQRLCSHVGITLVLPDGVDALCCGTPWSSKGLTDGYEVIVSRTVEAIVAACDGGRLPVVCDASSCTEGLVKALAGTGVQVVDAVAFAAEHVVPKLGEHERLASLTLHPTCSSTQLGLGDALLAVGREIADDVAIPVAWGCCAFAGDRGLLHPELTASATAAEAAEVRERGAETHASCNRTCELGMTRATGHEYRHVLELLADVVLQ